jgi:hypothetical protein
VRPAPDDIRHGASARDRCSDGGPTPTSVGDDLFSRLSRVSECVAGMESCLGTRRPSEGSIFADALVQATTELLDDLDQTLNTDPAWDVELISTLRVYRNAGFMFRKLAGPEGRGDPATEERCATLIKQGHDHVRVLVTQFLAPEAFATRTRIALVQSPRRGED